MSLDPLVLSKDLEAATARLIETARTLDGAGLAAPSLCSGWTRGHVLAHISRNADSLVNLLTWARTGVETPQYASDDEREAGIAAGAGRPIDEQLDDLRASAGRFAAAVDAMPTAAWSATVRPRGGGSTMAATLVWGRLREVEVHHVDLDAGYGPIDWPEAFTGRLLHELARTLPGLDLTIVPDGQPPLTIGAGGPTVSGPAWALAGWLTGRNDGAPLRGELPKVPTWK
jgi:maleylpyruvate isomerase